MCEIYDLAKPDELAGVVVPSAISPLESDASMKRLFAESKIWVAEVDSRPVAFAGYRANLITWLFVHPGFRRLGVASELLRQLLKSVGRPVTLNVASGNTRARNLYTQFGFHVEREFMGNFQGSPCPVARLCLS